MVYHSILLGPLFFVLYFKISNANCFVIYVALYFNNNTIYVRIKAYTNSITLSNDWRTMPYVICRHYIWYMTMYASITLQLVTISSVLNVCKQYYCQFRLPNRKKGLKQRDLARITIYIYSYIDRYLDIWHI